MYTLYGLKRVNFSITIFAKFWKIGRFPYDSSWVIRMRLIPETKNIKPMSP